MEDYMTIAIDSFAENLTKQREDVLFNKIQLLKQQCFIEDRKLYRILGRMNWVMDVNKIKDKLKEGGYEIYLHLSEPTYDEDWNLVIEPEKIKLIVKRKLFEI